jgi:quinol monooxygenase YgiN
LNARPEKRAELITLLESFVDRSGSGPGCIDYHFHVSAADPTIFYFYENWTTRADLDRHLELPYQKEWFGRHAEFLTKPAELKFFDMPSEHDKRQIRRMGGGRPWRDYAGGFWGQPRSLANG